MHHYFQNSDSTICISDGIAFYSGFLWTAFFLDNPLTYKTYKTYKTYNVQKMPLMRFCSLYLLFDFRKKWLNYGTSSKEQFLGIFRMPWRLAIQWIIREVRSIACKLNQLFNHTVLKKREKNRKQKETTLGFITEISCACLKWACSTQSSRAFKFAFTNRPRSIYCQYSNVAPRLLGQNRNYFFKT